MVKVWRLAELLLLVIAVMAAMIFVALWREHGTDVVPILLITMTCAVGVYFIDKRVKKLNEPKKIVIPADFRGPLKIYLGKKRLMVLTVAAVVCLAPAQMMYEGGKPGVAIGLGIFGLFALLALISSLRNLGMPYLVLDDQGITTQTFGRIPWSDVDNASLQAVQHRGSTIYGLKLSVYEPDKYFQRTGFFRRLFRVKWLELPSERDRLGIPLNMLSHEPLYIDAVVKHLRAQYSRRLGITPKSGVLSIDRRFSEADKLMGSLKFDDSPEKIHATMAKIDGLMGEVNLEIQASYKNGRKQTRILLAVFLVLGAFVVAIHIMGK
jgi:hypothetical protein